MNRLLSLGAASFAATTLLVLLSALQAELSRPAPVALAAAPVLSSAEAATAINLAGPGTGTVVARTVVIPSPEPAPAPASDAYIELEPLDAPQSGPWSPPNWFPEEARPELWSLDGIGDGTDLNGNVGPRLPLSSRAVFVYDIDSGEVLLAQNADDRRPVASLTKLVAGLAMASESPDLDEVVCLDVSIRPSWPGATTKLRSDSCASGWDLLGAALVKSDNGAAMALSQVSGLPYDLFVERMNTVAMDLGMTMSSFSDPSGAEDDNLSTARDITRAVLAASRHPELQPAASAPFWDLHDEGRDKVRRLTTTNRLWDRERTEVVAAKTGYTDTARHCFTGVFRTRDGREVAITILGAYWNRQRWSDVRRILEWVESREE